MIFIGRDTRTQYRPKPRNYTPFFIDRKVRVSISTYGGVHDGKARRGDKKLLQSLQRMAQVARR